MSDRKKIGCWEWTIALVALVALIASGCYMDSKIRESMQRKLPQTESKAPPEKNAAGNTPPPITLANLYKNGTNNGI